MNNLIRAELLKVRASRTTWVFAVLAPLTCALWAALQVALAGQEIANVYNMAQQAYVFTLLLGVLGMTGEFRHQTITWAFLVTPRRGRVVTAKLVAYGLAGLAIAVGSALVTLAAGAALLTLNGHPAMSAEVPPVLAGAVLSTTAYTLLGVGLGALIRRQVVAVTAALLWFMYGDYLLTSMLPEVGRWLPTGAARALGGMQPQAGELLPMWAGGLLFAAYVTAVVLAARLLTLRRDVT